MMYNDELQHFGVKGMKWGVRRYSNSDGTLNAAGKRRYGVDSVSDWKTKKKEMKADKKSLTKKASKKYQLSKSKAMANREDRMNNRRRELNRQLFGNANYANTSSVYKEKYERNQENARNYVESSMKKKYGRSYSTWEKSEEKKRMVASGLAFAGSVGLIGASMYKLSKK